MSSRSVVQSLYEAFSRHDGEAMAACYRPDATFCDSAFGELTGASVGNMWRMLTSRGGDTTVVTFRDVRVEGDKGWAHWEAKYKFAG